MRCHTRALRAMLLPLLALWCSGLARAALPDGPYVLPAASGWEAVSVEASGEVTHQPLTGPAPSVTVPAVGAVPAFTVTLRAPSTDAPDSVRTAKNAPIFVVADTHGEYEILAAMLRTHGVIGDDLKWTFARGHLVVLGDVFDRGAHHLEILWLLYGLEAQAAAAGGGVHFVLGNHEAMALGGDPSYLNAKYNETARAIGVSNYFPLFAADTLLGQWLRTRSAILLLNGDLYLHGGVSRALVDSRLTLAEINAAVRSAMKNEPGQGAIADLVMGSLGPLWYRGYFAQRGGMPSATAEDVSLALEAFGARRIFVGHTIVPTITPLYGGKVLAVQVYPRRDEAGQTHFEALLIRGGQLWQALPDGSLRRLRKGPPS